MLVSIERYLPLSASALEPVYRLDLLELMTQRSASTLVVAAAIVRRAPTQLDFLMFRRVLVVGTDICMNDIGSQKATLKFETQV